MRGLLCPRYCYFVGKCFHLEAISHWENGNESNNFGRPVMQGIKHSLVTTAKRSPWFRSLLGTLSVTPVLRKGRGRFSLGTPASSAPPLFLHRVKSLLDGSILRTKATPIPTKEMWRTDMWKVSLQWGGDGNDVDLNPCFVSWRPESCLVLWVAMFQQLISRVPYIITWTNIFPVFVF